MSTWLVHADGVREAIERAREQQRAEPAPPPPPGHVASQGLRTDLALARDEIKRLRTQVEELRGNLRRALGYQLGDIGQQRAPA